MHTITLGPARIGDAPWIAALSRSLIEAGLPWSWTPRRVAAHMRMRESLVVTAQANTLSNTLVGFVMAQFGSESVHLTLLGVVDTHQRQGVGRQLLQWVEESAVVAGLFTVNLEVRVSNYSARRFYAALGYRESGSLPKYYSGVEDAVRFSRSLNVQT